MLKILKNEKNKFIAIFIILLAVCYFIPYTHDDWAWGTQIGLDRLNSAFKDYNGRWAGNLVELLLTRSTLIKAIAMSGIFTGTIYLILKLNNNNFKNIYLVTLLLLMIPREILREAVTWVAGFSNYVFPVILVLGLLYLNRGIFENDIKFSKKICCANFILGFIVCLFVEHVTLYMLFICFVGNVYYFAKNKKVSINLIMLFIGLIMGSVLMFSNGAYYKTVAGEDDYRSIQSDSLIKASIIKYFNKICYCFSLGNIGLNICLSIVVLINIFEYSKSYKCGILKYIIMFILIFMPMYSLITLQTKILLLKKYTKYFNGLLVALYYCSVALSAFIYVEDNKRKTRIIFSLCSIAILTAPLLIVNPIGGRNFYPMYIFWIYIVTEFYECIDKKENNFICTVLMCAIITYMFYYSCIFGYVFKVNIEREKYIKDNKDNDTLLLPKLPYAEYMWNPNPVNGLFMERFKKFYKIDQNKDAQLLEYGDWKNKK